MPDLPDLPDRRPDHRRDRPPSLAAMVVVGGLAVFGAIALVQFLLASLLGIVRFGIAVVVVIAALGWLLGRRAER